MRTYIAKIILPTPLPLTQQQTLGLKSNLIILIISKFSTSKILALPLTSLTSPEGVVIEPRVSEARAAREVPSDEIARERIGDKWVR